MLLFALIALSSGTLLIMLVLLIKQWNANSVYQQFAKQLSQLASQTQTTEQQLRENLLINLANLQQAITEKLGHARLEQNQHTNDLKEQLQHAFSNHRARFDERQLETLKILQDTLQKGVQDNRQQVKESLFDHAKELSKRVEQLTATTEGKLKEINQQVEKRLTEGFEKTNETFGDVIKRLTLIDVAQKKITELSSNVVSLQEI